MTFRELRALIGEDYRANGSDATRAGFRTLMVYRFGVWRMSVRSRLLRAPLTMIYRRAFVHCRNVYGIELPFTAKVGRRVIIEHQGGIVIHGHVTIGDECIIRQNCTLGVRRIDRPGDAPTLGARVNLGAGAVVLGAVTIGDGAAIGANAVVLCDVPAGALAIGVPATVRLRG
ncbi:serine O-acetyltransferase [Sphingomonas sp. Tas61C01]|uniref:serine O-acetyltransferase n=1 Tax=Sphingomonas sp. Tas61C01 TaxID=3458297 RepID=UPI00403E9DD5